ncbi:MAG: hypothetical protein ACM3PZ_03345 [Bacillota bacterium]
MKRPLRAIIMGLGLAFVFGARPTGRGSRDGDDDEGALPASLLNGAAMPADGDNFVDVSRSLFRWPGKNVTRGGRLTLARGRIVSGKLVVDSIGIGILSEAQR